MLGKASFIRLSKLNKFHLIGHGAKYIKYNKSKGRHGVEYITNIDHACSQVVHKVKVLTSRNWVVYIKSNYKT